MSESTDRLIAYVRSPAGRQFLVEDFLAEVAGDGDEYGDGDWSNLDDPIWKNALQAFLLDLAVDGLPDMAVAQAVQQTDVDWAAVWHHGKFALLAATDGDM